MKLAKDKSFVSSEETSPRLESRCSFSAAALREAVIENLLDRGRGGTEDVKAPIHGGASHGHSPRSRCRGDWHRTLPQRPSRRAHGVGDRSPNARVYRSPRDRVEIDLESRIADVAEPALRILLKAAAQQVANRVPASPRAAPASPARARGSPASVSETVSPRERRAARQHLVEHAAERPDVGPFVDRLARAPARGSCRPPSRGSCRHACRRS